MNQSLDGYVDHREIGPPDPVLSRHFMEQACDSTGMVYGRRIYEIMRYWDDDLPDWDAEDRDFAAVAEQTDVGCVALVEVGRPQRHTPRG